MMLKVPGTIGRNVAECIFIYIYHVKRLTLGTLSSPKY